VVVMGGGILGLASAYELARAGVGRIVVLERGQLAAAATSRAAAMFNRARPRPGERQMVRDTEATVAELEDELGESLGYRRVGSLKVATSTAEQQALAALVADCVAEGDDIALVGADEATERTPWLRAGDGDLIAWCPDDGYVDPYLLATAYGRAARERGVQVHQQVEVTAIEAHAGRVAAVRTPSGDIAASTVVDAAGAWAGLVPRPLGVGLPLAPVRSHYWITESAAPFDSSFPVVMLPDARAYARPEVGHTIVGIRDARSAWVTPQELPAELTGFAFGDDPTGMEAFAAGVGPLLGYMPALAEVGIKDYICGPSAYTPDGAFVIGRVAALEGFVAVGGCCGAGIAHSAGFARAAAALVGGEAPPYDLSPYDPDRFGAVDPCSAELCARCAASRSTKTAA
jgi:4-methylaminobutanoate oxidase (formaldehyde-forming)